MTVLGDAVELLQDFGFFDVMLPFLLVFTIVFGILERTAIFGTEMIQGKEYSKKNINAMLSFTIAFFVVTAKEIVVAIQEALPMVSLMLIAVISFLLLVGSFVTNQEFKFLDLFKGWTQPLAGLFFVSLVLIFFQSFGWLEPIWDWMNGFGSETFIIIIFTAITIGVIAYITDSGELKKPKGDTD
jgi:hypothetical protein